MRSDKAAGGAADAHAIQKSFLIDPARDANRSGCEGRSSKRRTRVLSAAPWRPISQAPLMQETDRRPQGACRKLQSYHCSRLERGAGGTDTCSGDWPHETQPLGAPSVDHTSSRGAMSMRQAVRGMVQCTHRRAGNRERRCAPRTSFRSAVHWCSLWASQSSNGSRRAARNPDWTSSHSRTEPYECVGPHLGLPGASGPDCFPSISCAVNYQRHGSLCDHISAYRLRPMFHTRSAGAPRGAGLLWPLLEVS